MEQEPNYCGADGNVCGCGNCVFWKGGNGDGPEGYCVLDFFTKICER